MSADVIPLRPDAQTEPDAELVESDKRHWWLSYNSGYNDGFESAVAAMREALEAAGIPVPRSRHLRAVSS